MNWLQAHWKSVTATVAALATVGAIAQVGAEVQTKLSELEQTSEIAKANATAVGALVDIHEQEAIEAEKEAMRREYEENLAALMQQIADQMEELERLRANADP